MPGQEPANGYFQFHFTAYFKKKRYLKGLAAERRSVEEVYLVENDHVEEEQLVQA